MQVRADHLEGPTRKNVSCTSMAKVVLLPHVAPEVQGYAWVQHRQVALQPRPVHEGVVIRLKAQGEGKGISTPKTVMCVSLSNLAKVAQYSPS
jgi:hypothetical protein